jgi:hypothetical protein
VLPEGLEAGLAGALAVALVFLARDLWIGEPLHTPTVLGVLILQGAEAARETRSAPGAAALYNAVHFAVWTAAGFVSAWAAGRPQRGALIVVGMAWVVSALLLDALVAETGLGRSHLWLGGVAGTAAMGAYLAWRHPSLRPR